MTDKLPPPSFRAWIEEEKLVLDDPASFTALIQKLNGERVTLTLKKFRKGRSLNQNAYLHGIVIPMIAEACGYEPGEAKAALKDKFLREDFEDGKLPRIRSTASLSTYEMTEFIEQCRRLAAEMFSLNIPDPGECD